MRYNIIKIYLKKFQTNRKVDIMNNELNCFLAQLTEVLENQQAELIKTNQELYKNLSHSIKNIRKEINELKGAYPFSTLSDIYRKLDELDITVEEYHHPHPYKNCGFHFDEDYDDFLLEECFDDDVFKVSR